MSFNKISVVGLGYIGLPTAAVIASRKILVNGVDIDPKIVAAVNRGEIHIVEPGLGPVVQNAVDEGFLRATLTPEPASAFLIAVPTPFKGEGKEPDLTFVKAACAAIAPVLEEGNLVVLESTSPVGATEKMAQWLSDVRPDLSFPQDQGEHSDIRIAHCPERVLPGHVLKELLTNDRVIGGMTPKCSDLAVGLYKMFVEADCITTNARTAEMAKLTENSFRDVNIAFANELSMICDEFDIDVWELISLANRHPRVDILRPGPGVGGHCIAVDPWFIVDSAPETAQIIRKAREVNDYKPEWVINKINSTVLDVLSGSNCTLQELKIVLRGVTFKPDVDDIRESPALQIISDLSKALSCQLVVIDPLLSNCPEIISNIDNLTFSQNEDCALDADIDVLLVNHSSFQQSKCSVVLDFCKGG